jgi:hypothetical protein
MTASPPVWEQPLKEAEQSCRIALEDAPAGIPAPESCFSALLRIGSGTSKATLSDSSGVHGGSFPRWLLLNASLAAIGRVRNWPVADSVKKLWAEEILFCARMAPAASPIFDPRDKQFREFARIVTLRRAPAGQFHWEMAGLPRSYILHTPKRKWPELIEILERGGIGILSGAVRGFPRFADLHLNVRRKNRLTVSEREGMLTYFRLARSLELQPEVRGVCTCSWLYCETTGNVTPPLAWLRRFYLENGAFIASIGPAPSDSGFLEGSEMRRKLHAEGRYSPRMTYALWLRDDILTWANRNPELEASA